MTDIVERLNDSLSAGYSELRKEAAVEIMRLRAKITEMERQEPVGKIVAFGESLHEPSWRGGRLPPLMTELYTLPGAQNVPKEAIAKILTEVMNIAVANGADSRSMPDEYVEVAAWLCGIPAQNATSIPEG